MDRRRRSIDELFVRSAEPSPSPLKVDEGLNIFLLPEIGPKGGGDVEFAIGDLPEIKIAHAHLPAGANQQIRIRHLRRIQLRGDRPLVDRVGIEPPVARGALGALFRLNCERGKLDGQILLAPTHPLTVQALRLRVEGAGSCQVDNVRVSRYVYGNYCE